MSFQKIDTFSLAPHAGPIKMVQLLAEKELLHVRIYAHTHARTHAHTHTDTHTFMHACIHTQADRHTHKAGAEVSQKETEGSHRGNIQRPKQTCIPEEQNHKFVLNLHGLSGKVSAIWLYWIASHAWTLAAVLKWPLLILPYLASGVASIALRSLASPIPTSVLRHFCEIVLPKKVISVALFELFEGLDFFAPSDSTDIVNLDVQNHC